MENRRFDLYNGRNNTTTVVGPNSNYGDFAQGRNEQTTYMYGRQNVNDIATIVRQKQTSTSCVAKTNIVGKTRLIALISIIALMSFLLIYNAITMIALGSNIEATQVAIQSQQEQLLDLKTVLNEVSNEQVIMEKVVNAGFSVGASTVGTGVLEPEFVEPETFAVQSNWFDQVCEFLSSIFGG